MDMSWLNNSIGLIAGIISIITGAIAIHEFRTKRGRDKEPPKPDPALSVVLPTKQPVKPIGSNKFASVVCVKEFVGDDAAYQQWINDHPQGFVINAASNKDKNYMVLHRTKCHTVSNFGASYKPGAFTERQYIKVCADNVDPLRQWTSKNGRADEATAFSGVCSICKPE